ncbi:hypothetical protein [Agromyces soli]|nr:hypothetical protein [Agromyces soli]
MNHGGDRFSVFRIVMTGRATRVTRRDIQGRAFTLPAGVTAGETG